jgi:hypothetical protein
MYDAVKIPHVSPRSRADIEALAKGFLAKYAPACLEIPRPTPTVKLFDQVLPNHLDFRPRVEELAPGLEGITDCVEREVTLAPHIYEGMEKGVGRCRFAAAHEFGHVVMHADELAARVGVKFMSGSKVLLARRSDIKPFRNPEWQADAFAAAVLMPATTVRRALLGAAPADMWSNVTSTFAVSREAAEYRLQTLGLHPSARRH